MKKRLTATREVLSDLRDDFSLCGKCKLCQACHVQEVDHARFWRNCPAGTRFRFDNYYASGRMEMARAYELCEIEVTPGLLHSLYTCMLCGSCQQQCFPLKQINPLRVTELMRETAVREGWGPLPEHQPALDNLEEHDNLMGLPQADRGKWAEGLDLKDATQEEVDILLFTGCHYSYNQELVPSARSAARLLSSTGESVGILGEEELCCGAPLLELGDRDWFETFAWENIQRINATGAKTVVTLCPHCAVIFSEEYAPELDAEVKHASQALAQAIKERKIQPSQGVTHKVAWHDPCRLGRRLGIYDAPRHILASIPDLETVELPRHRGNSLCCGNGGMAAYAFPDYGVWVAQERIFEAEFTGAESLITSCPWCEEMLRRGTQARGSDLVVENLYTLLEKGMGGED